MISLWNGHSWAKIEEWLIKWFLWPFRFLAWSIWQLYYAWHIRPKPYLPSAQYELLWGRLKAIKCQCRVSVWRCLLICLLGFWWWWLVWFFSSNPRSQTMLYLPPWDCDLCTWFYHFQNVIRKISCHRKKFKYHIKLYDIWTENVQNCNWSDGSQYSVGIAKGGKVFQFGAFRSSWPVGVGLTPQS